MRVHDRPKPRRLAVYVPYGSTPLDRRDLVKQTRDLIRRWETLSNQARRTQHWQPPPPALWCTSHSVWLVWGIQDPEPLAWWGLRWDPARRTLPAGSWSVVTAVGQHWVRMQSVSRSEPALIAWCFSPQSGLFSFDRAERAGPVPTRPIPGAQGTSVLFRVGAYIRTGHRPWRYMPDADS